MGIAERFKNKIEEQNIFENKIEQKLNSNDIKFISKPTAQNQDVKPQSKNTQPDSTNSRIREIETTILNKISKTPYWNEFSNVQKEKMIGAYFEKKTNNSFTKEEQKEFIKNIILKSTK